MEKKVKKAILISLSFLFAHTLFAQDIHNSIPKKKFLPGWQIGGFGIHVGGIGDSFSNLSGEGLKSMMNGSFNTQMDLSNFIEEDYGYSTELTGGNIGFHIFLKRPSRSRFFDQELRFTVSANVGRELMIDYVNPDTKDEDEWGYYYNEGITYCLVENEIVLSTSYLFKLNLGKRLSLYGGPTASLGGTFNNTMFIFTNNFEVDQSSQESFQNGVSAKASHYMKAGGHAGIGYNMFDQRVMLSVEGIAGAGAQVVHGSRNNLLDRTYQVNVGLRYNFRR